MFQTSTRWSSIIAAMCLLAAVYGIGFGFIGILVGLFVGPHILLAGLAHVALGFAYLVAASGIRRQKIWASGLATACAVPSAVIGSIAVYQSFSTPDTVRLVFWLSFTAYFLCLAILSSVQWSFRA